MCEKDILITLGQLSDTLLSERYNVTPTGTRIARKRVFL